MRDRLKIVVGGFLGLTPGGGVAWDYVQWPLGFTELGHDVVYVEDTRLWPMFEAGATGTAANNIGRVRSVMEAFGLGGRWAYRDELSGECWGLSLKQLTNFCRSADLFVNLSCSTFMRDEYLGIPVRALVDTDPMFTQLQYCHELSLTSSRAGMREMFSGHTHFFTFGENIGANDCRVPRCSVEWVKTRQPICLDHWNVRPLVDVRGGRFTTVMNWSAGRDLQFDGETWGQKNISLLRYLALPQTMEGVELAVAVGQTSGREFPAQQFRDHGWTVLDPEQCAPDWRAYQVFLEESSGEFSIAKQTYVRARTGWFSCRSACYLAAGRPVVAEDTGWSEYIPSGRGLLAFSDPEEARAALCIVLEDPKTHGKAARELAEEYFHADRVLDRMLSQAGSPALARQVEVE